MCVCKQSDPLLTQKGVEKRKLEIIMCLHNCSARQSQQELVSMNRSVSVGVAASALG